MKAEELGELLQDLGVPVLGYREDDGYLGALVRVTDSIHVEILPCNSGFAITLVVSILYRE